MREEDKKLLEIAKQHTITLNILYKWMTDNQKSKLSKLCDEFFDYFTTSVEDKLSDLNNRKLSEYLQDEWDPDIRSKLGVTMFLIQRAWKKTGVGNEWERFREGFLKFWIRYENVFINILGKDVKGGPFYIFDQEESDDNTPIEEIREKLWDRDFLKTICFNWDNKDLGILDTSIAIKLRNILLEICENKIDNISERLKYKRFKRKF